MLSDRQNPTVNAFTEQSDGAFTENIMRYHLPQFAAEHYGSYCPCFVCNFFRKLIFS